MVMVRQMYSCAEFNAYMDYQSFYRKWLCTKEWTGAWGSDGPILTGDLNGDGKTDVFMWRAASNSWTVNLSNGNGFTQQEWKGMWGSDGPIFTGDLNGDGKTDVFMWRNSTHTWTVNLSNRKWLCTKGVDWRMGVGLLISSQNCTSFRAKLHTPLVRF